VKSIVIRETRDRPARTFERFVVVQRAVRTPNARVRVGVRVGASGVTGGDGSTTAFDDDVRVARRSRRRRAGANDRSMDRMLALALAFKLNGWSDASNGARDRTR
jgi:hypothetical protein